MSITKELKMNNRILVREACRVTANRFKTADSQIKKDLTDAAMIVKNTPDDVIIFVKVLSESLNKRAFDHIGGVQHIMNRLSRPNSHNYNYLCVYDFYKVLRDSKYFAVERALNRISEFGQRKEGMSFTRKNARRHYICSATPTMKSYTQSFCSEFNYNWRMILTLGSRLCSADNRSLQFKTDKVEPHPYIVPKMIDGCDNKFEIRVASGAPVQTYAQIRAFLDAVNEEVLRYVFSGNVFTVTVYPKQNKVGTLNTEDIKKLAFTGGYTPDKIQYFKLPQPVTPAPTPIEEHYFKELEKSVNEITLIVDGYDIQIDDLTAKTDKLRAQRGKLLHAMKALRS